MAQNNYHVYVLDEEPKTYVYTTSENDNTIALLRTLGFKFQYTVYTYGWSVKEGLMYSLHVYLNIKNENTMLKLVRISNGHEVKIHELYKEVYSAQGVARSRWWEYYSVKK